MEVFKVASLEEAVRLAAKFKQEGRFDWFRGQRKCWPPTTSAGRLDAAGRKQAKEKLKQYYLWLGNTPGLEALSRDVTACLAVAQHHGLATTFLDFTVEPGVAGYFAATRKGRVSGTSCIYCLNTADLRKVWDFFRKALPKYPDVQFHDITVPNLWRMEAQDGRFLECATNWEKIYPMERIEFPASRPLPRPTEDEIYPERKSHLEVLLDHQFEVGFLKESAAAIRKAFPGIDVLEIRGPDKGYFPEYFRGGRLPELKSWHRRALVPWLAVETEPYHRTVRGNAVLRVDLRRAPGKVRAVAEMSCRRLLAENAQLRSQAVRWEFEGGGMPPKLRAALETLWNGLRRHPWTDEQITAAVGLCVGLWRAGFQRADDSEQRAKAAGLCLGTVMEVEFSSREGDPVRGVVSTAALLKAVRADIRQRVRTEQHQYLWHPGPLLQFCMNPRRLFEFGAFADVFVRQIVPSQVLHVHNNAHIFTPGRIVGLGLP